MSHLQLRCHTCRNKIGITYFNWDNEALVCKFKMVELRSACNDMNQIKIWFACDCSVITTRCQYFEFWVWCFSFEDS